MTDTVTREKRSQIMRAIRSKDAKIEIALRKELWKRGLRYRKHFSGLMGKPDIVFVKDKIAIFIDSCFWHGCPYHCRMPHSSRAYWNSKIKRNKKRDKEVNKWYKANRWKIFRFWEHTISGDIRKCVKKIMNAFKER